MGIENNVVILVLIKLYSSLTISTWKRGLNYLIDSYRPTINSNNANYFTLLFLPHYFLQIANNLNLDWAIVKNPDDGNTCEDFR